MNMDNENQHISEDDEIARLLKQFLQADEDESLRMLAEQGEMLFSDSLLQRLRDQIAASSEVPVMLKKKLLLLEETRKRRDIAASMLPPAFQQMFNSEMMQQMLRQMPNRRLALPDQEQIADVASILPPEMLAAFTSFLSSPSQQSLLLNILQQASLAEEDIAKIRAGLNSYSILTQNGYSGLVDVTWREIWKLPLEERQRLFRGEIQVLNSANIQAYADQHQIDLSSLPEQILPAEAVSSDPEQALVEQQSFEQEDGKNSEQEAQGREIPEIIQLPPAPQESAEPTETLPQAGQEFELSRLIHELQQAASTAGNAPLSLSPEMFDQIVLPTGPLPGEIRVLYRILFLLKRSEKGLSLPELTEARQLLRELRRDSTILSKPGSLGPMIEQFEHTLELVKMEGGTLSDQELAQRIENTSEILGRNFLAADFPIEPGAQSADLALQSIALLHRCLAYLERANHQQRENIAQAIKDCSRLIELGIAFQQRIIEAYGYMVRGNIRAHFLQSGKNPTDLQLALRDFEQALHFFTEEIFPDEWAEIHLSRSIAYRTHEYGDIWSNYEHALEDSQKALARLSSLKQQKPLHWAAAHKACGDAYARRLSRDPLGDAWKAHEHYEQALQVFTVHNAPEEWASTRIALIANQRRLLEFALTGGRREPKYDLFASDTPFVEAFADLYTGHQRLIADLTELLALVPRERDAYNWADAHFERAFTRAIIAPGERKQLLKSIFEDFEHAMEVFTLAKYPTRWANIQLHIATFLQRFTIESPEKDARAALRAIDAALTVFTAEETPFEYYRAQELRAMACERLQLWKEAQQSLCEARSVEVHLMSATQSGKRFYDLLARFTRPEISLRRAQIALHLDPPACEEAAIALEEGRAQGLQRAQRPSEQDQGPTSSLSLAEMVRCLPHQQAALVYLTAGTSFSASGDMDRQLSLGVEEGFALILTRATDGKPHVEALPLPHLTNIALDFLQEPLVDARQQETSLLDKHMYESRRGNNGRSRSLPIKLELAITKLGEMGLSDLARHLCANKISEVTLVPYGNLGLFPWNALQVTLADGSSSYFGELFEVSLAPSAYAAVQARQRAELANTVTTVLAAGNPQPQIQELELLPYAAGEAQMVYELARTQNYATHYLPSEQVTREQLLYMLRSHESKPQLYVHLAIHALYHLREPRNSQLMLAGTNEIAESERCIFAGELLDGAITLAGVRLLVLSACQSSVIDIQQVPNEALGLAAAFLQAGSAGVIASLWKVDDIATYLLMTRFAQLYLQARGGISPAKALAQAQHWLREEATYQALVEYNPLNLPAHDPLAQELSLAEEYKAQAARTPDALPFARAEYWAGFTLNGY